MHHLISGRHEEIICHESDFSFAGSTHITALHGEHKKSRRTKLRVVFSDSCVSNLHDFA